MQPMRLAPRPLCLLALLIAILSPRIALAHSVLTCTDYRPQGELHAANADEACHARPRGYKRAVAEAHSIACLVYRPGNGGHAAEQKPEFGNGCSEFSSFGKGGFACDPDLGRRTLPFDAGYDSSAPFAVYKPGRSVCLEWPNFGHAKGIVSPQFPKPPGVPYSVGPIYILATPARVDADPSQKDLWGGSGGKALAMLPYDDCDPDPQSANGFLQNKFYNDSGPLDRARPCRGCFTLPPTMQEGLWVFQWMFEMNKDEWYSTCWDAVISAAGDSYTAPPPKLSAPLPRADSLPSAGTGTTMGWQAAPLQQVSSAAPACPAGLSGPLCSPGGGGAGSTPLVAGASPGAGGSPDAGSLPRRMGPPSPPVPAGAGAGAPISATGSTVRPPGSSLQVPQVSGYEAVPGQELHGLYDYSCPGSISSMPDQECQHDGAPAELAQLCNADPQCQVIAYYQFGSGGRTTPTAWFKGGPSPQNIYAFTSPPNPDAVLYIKKATPTASAG